MGYVVGTYGNVSVRAGSDLIITPSRIDYRALTPDDLVVVSIESGAASGSRLPSSEMEVHRQIYCARPDLGAVAHTHSLYATALSCMHRDLPVIVEEQSQVIGDEIRCTHYVPAGQHRKLGEEVARALGKSNAVLLANHGTASCGRTLAEALFTCRITERVAQMYLLASAAGAPVPIPQEYVLSEHDRYVNKYGTTRDHE
ncbi:MAG: class II aldolase/adducin family protein [Chloroflexota bacterium]|nr:class II aldolase/adducin family protein [Chloroflexota bacterium]